MASFDDATHVFVADAATGKSVQVTKTPLLATLVTSIEWTADGKSIVTVLVPDGRGLAPTHGRNGVEDGPEVRLTESRALPQVIHPSLLEDPHDKALLTYYTTGQLALIDVKSKTARKIGAPATIRAVDISPDGRYLRVTRMVEPYSYIVPVTNFGSVQELWDLSGKVVATLAKTPLRESNANDNPDAPGGRGGPQQTASDSGKRNLQWNPVGNGLVYMQSVFGAAAGAPSAPARTGRGQQQRPQPTSIRYMSWLPPYGPSDTKLIYEGSPRLTSVAFSADGRTMFVSDSGVFAVRTADPSRKFNLGAGVALAGGGGGRGGGGGGRGGAGAAADSTGGTRATRPGPNGSPVVVLASDNKTVFLSGTRAPGAKWNTQAPRPWVDKLDIETGQRARLLDSPADAYEEFVTALDDDYSQFIYTRESPTVIADAYLRDVKANTSTQLTHARDVGPEVSGAQHRQVQVTRPRDGIKFWVDITLPRDWRPGTQLPGIIWFYPREYTSQAEYDRSRYVTNIQQIPGGAVGTAGVIDTDLGVAGVRGDRARLSHRGRLREDERQLHARPP